MRRLNSKPKDKRNCVCPQCKKRRMIRSLKHEVSDAKQSYTTKDKTEVELFVDICDWCKRRNSAKYFEPSKADIRSVLRTLREDAEISDGKSLEDLL